MNECDELPPARPMPRDVEARVWQRIEDGMRGAAGSSGRPTGRRSMLWRAAGPLTVAAAAAAGLYVAQPWASQGRAPMPAPMTSSPGAQATAPGRDEGPVRLAGSVTPLDTSPLWSGVAFPVPPSKGRSIAQAGAVIVEAGLRGTTLVVANSSDSGATWTTNQVQLAHQVPYVDVALSADGKHWVVGPPHEGSIGAASTYTQAYVASPSGTLQTISMPGPAAHAAWAGSTLLVSGGANGSHLWASADSGQSFADVTANALGFTPPTVNSDGPVMGALLQLADGVGVVAMTKNGDGSDASVYITHDGTRFAPITSLSFPRMQPGPLNGLTSTYGSDAVIMASTRRLIRVTASGEVQTITMQGLPDVLTTVAIQFRDTAKGMANVTVSSCSDGKAGCTDQKTNYTTSDGGHTWTRTPQ